MKTTETKPTIEATHSSSSFLNNKKAPYFPSSNYQPDAFIKAGTKASSLGIVQKKETKRLDKKGNLPDGIREKMEYAFEADFSDVTVKQNSKDAKELNAVAFTQGNEISFAPGHNPYSSGGQNILGHELAHVIQQREGRVQPTNREMGRAVNDEVILEAEADKMGRKAASGDKIRTEHQFSNHKSSSIQKKGVEVIQKQIQPLPSGAPIPELVIDSHKVMREFNDLWSTRSNYYRNNWNFDTINSLYDHPDLPSLVRGVCGGDYFRGSNYWSSGWIDDGDVDILWSGDADLKAEMTMYVDYGAVTHSGSGKFGSTSSTEDERSSTESTTVSGEVTSSIGGHEGAPGAEATAGIEHTSESGHTMSVHGGSSLEMELPSNTFSADVFFELRLSLRPSISGAETWSNSRMTRKVGHAIIGRPNQSN